MTASPTFTQIRAHVAAVRKKFSNATAIGLRSAGRWTGEPTATDGTLAYLIRQCDSPLAARLALREPAGDGTIRVLLTPLDERELGDDVLVRLAKRSLFSLDPWQVVQSLFQAHAIDPLLAAHGWIADELLDLLPAGDYPPVSAGFLDAETVWTQLLARRWGFDADAPDLIALLLWSANPASPARLRASSAVFRDAATEWLADRAGPAAKLVLRSIARSELPDALAVGLAAGVIFHPEAAGKLEKAAGRFEATYLDGQSVEAGLITRWAAASSDAIHSATLSEKARRQQLAQLDDILRETGAAEFAYLSDVSPLGFDRRLIRIATLIDEATRAPAVAATETLRRARQAVAAHAEAKRETLRLDRVDMALRLVRRLSTPSKPPSSLADAAAHHANDGGHADWARFLLRSPEPVRELADAYARLFEATTTVREREAEQFAGRLQDWTAAGGSVGEGVIPVEQILAEIVAPLSAVAPVLFVVVDGMSVAVYRELLADLTGYGWVSLAEPGRDRVRPGLATVPSWTVASRASLLCGRLVTGDQRVEREGFATHPQLLENCKNGHPPILFHKATLESDDEVLNPAVRQAVESNAKRIVGVVVNAVDDHLLKGGQLEVRWSRDIVRVLPSLLHEARAAGRAVVLVADHGHILEAGTCEHTTSRSDEGGERWRVDDERPQSGEVRLEGPRVLVDDGRMIAPWSERIRYGAKKNGYHGGVSPQEMVVPIAVLWGLESSPADWTELLPEAPLWWEDSVDLVATAVTAPPATPKRPRQTLFDEDEVIRPAAKSEPGPVPATAMPASPEWIPRLLASEAFATQRLLGGRAVPADETFVQLLTALEARGGKLTSAALARTLSVPPLRLRGLLAAAQRVLNVDGYGILTRDDADDTVTLDRGLLLKQFDLS